MRACPPEGMHAREIPAVLTVAGSDSGGGAGIQADLKTFMALDVYGTSAVTCITAQNPDGVSGIASIEPCMVVEQIRAVRNAFPIKAAKTGMLYSATMIQAVAEVFESDPLLHLVVDPVMVATSGARLLREDAVRVLCDRFLPLATVVTPNLPEAEILSGRPIGSEEEQAVAAERIGRCYGVACVVKGGHRSGGDEVVDILWDGAEHMILRGTRFAAVETHGTGCTFSAALTAYLARGADLGEAVRAARDFVAKALRYPYCVGKHCPLGIAPVAGNRPGGAES
jgi:hydroxymethylpyrimidine/phosphomethylpyrimidine kinase